MKRILALLLCLVMVASVVAGCGAAKGAGATITACLAEEPKTIDPTLGAAVDSATYDVHLFEGLTTVNKNLEIVPGMAKEWSANADSSVYTFKLRDAKWSDGKPVTAHDFVFSWRRATDPATAAEYSYQMYYLKNAAAINSGEAPVDTLGVKAIDDKTLEVTLESPCSYFLYLTGFPTYFPVREDIVTANPEGWATSAETCVTNGPFKLKEWAHDSYILMEKNDSYWNAATILPKEIKFVLMADANTILASYKNGEILYSDIVPSEEIPALQASGDCIIDPLLGTRYFNFNMQKAPYNDVRVRKALSLAIDRNYIAGTVIGAGEMPANGFVPYTIPDAKPGPDFRTVGGEFWSTKPEDYEKNVAEARKLLAEAGFPDGKGFPAFSYITNDAGPNVKVAEAIQQNLKNALNLNMEVQVQEWAVFQEDRKNGNYDVCRGGWLGDYVDPMTFLDLFITESALNDPDFFNDEYDSLIDQAKKEKDNTKRYELMHQAEKILMDNWAIAPFSYYTEPQLISKKLKGQIHSPLGFKYFMWATVEK